MSRPTQLASCEDLGGIIWSCYLFAQSLYIKPICSIRSVFDDPTVSASYKTLWQAGSRLDAATHEARSM